MTKPSRKRLTALLLCLSAVWASPYSAHAQGGDAPIATPGGDAADVEMAEEDKTLEETIRNVEISKQQKEQRADELIFEGREELVARDYAVATEKFTQAERLLKDVSRTNSRVVRKQELVASLIASTYEEWADMLVEEAGYGSDAGDYERARTNYMAALDKDPNRSEAIMAKLQDLEGLAKLASIKAELQPSVVDPEHANRQEQILMAMERGKVFYKHAQLMRAREQFEHVLTKDPGHPEATVWLARLSERLYDEAKRRRLAMISDHLAQIEWAWIDPIPPPSEIDIPSGGGGVRSTGPGGNLQAKLKNIIIPKIKFEDTPVAEVIEHLRGRSVELDPDGAGINILLILGSGGGAAADGGGAVEAPAPAGDDGFGDDFLEEPVIFEQEAPAAAPVAAGPTITMEFKDIPLGEAIRYMCASSQLDFKTDDHAVIVFDPEKFKVEMETKFFAVPAGVFYAGATREGGDSIFGDDDDDTAEQVEGDDIQQKFVDMGVNFPPNSSITYNSVSSKLVVTNTSDELRKVEKILDEIIKQPSQITIEAKFVEIRENSLKETGFDWAFGGGRGGENAGGRIGNNGLYAYPNGGGDVPSGVVSDQKLTSGLRNLASTVEGIAGGNLLALNGILGNLEFNAVIHALDQSAGTDVLSAPKVTTMSGQTANVRLVERTRLVTEYTEPEIVTSSGGQVSVNPPVPVFGEEERFGIQLTVTPTVGEDEYTIDLELNPTVTKIIDEKVYSIEQVVGFTDDPTDPSEFPDQIPVVSDLNFAIPVVSERSIETRVLVYDGETVVLGGTIEDTIAKNDDKVPFLSKIPLIGKLFKSEGEYSEKTNLLIFVSARLVRPNGLPKRPSEIRGLPDFRR